MELDDSEEVYTYILCSICPVKMSKPGLGYYETEDKVDLRIRDWVVQTPVAGFLYPSFNERSSDVNEALFFSKKPKEIDHCFIDDLMCCESGRSKSEKKVEFDSIVEKVLEEYRDAEEKIYSFHERNCTQKKKVYLPLKKEDLRKMLLVCLALFENNGSLFDLEAEDCRMCPESFRNFVAVRTVKMTAGYPRDAYVKVEKNGKIKLGFYENSKIEIKI